MLRLNRMTDYSIVVLGALAHRRGDVVPSAQLAALTGINQPTVAKVAKLLQSAGLLVTQRGANGGYQLAGAPDDVTLVDIIEGVEGPIAVNDCVDGAQDPCAVSNCCFMSNNWNKVNQTVRDALEAVSLADLIDPAQLFPEMSPSKISPSKISPSKISPSIGAANAVTKDDQTSSVQREEEVPHGRNH